MQINHSKVNFKKLVRDFADMYQDTTFDVVVTELVANALDARATVISIDWDAPNAVLTITDDGIGMDEDTFHEYHDFAAEVKTRGDGIGFAGVGAKISFNIADRVLTETRRRGITRASDWYWHDEDELRWVAAASNLLGSDGTRVEVKLDPLHVPPKVDSNYLIGVLNRHYLPLLVTEFLDAYAQIGIYPNRPRFVINGSLIDQTGLSDATGLTRRYDIAVKTAGDNAVGWGALGVRDVENAPGSAQYGVLLCTHGKVIKSELFGQSTGLLGNSLFGIVEIPGLIEYLTTNKSDLKAGQGKGQGLNRMLNAVGDELRSFLAEHGVAVSEPKRSPLSAKLERELTKIVRQLPELQDFDGLLRRSRTLRKSDDGDVSTSPITRSTESGGTSGNGTSENTNSGTGGTSRVEDAGGQTKPESTDGHGLRE